MGHLIETDWAYQSFRQPINMSGNEPDLQYILSHSPGYLLATTHRVLSLKESAALVSMNLSLHEYVVLRLIGTKAHLSQGSLGNRYGIDPATMVDLIDKLENKGLLVRERNPEDRRKYLLHLTPKGNKVSSRASRLVRKQQKEFLAPLSDDQWESVRTGLWQLIQSHLEAGGDN